MDRGSETQFQVAENLNFFVLSALRVNMFNSPDFISQFAPGWSADIAHRTEQLKLDSQSETANLRRN